MAPFARGMSEPSPQPSLETTTPANPPTGTYPDSTPSLSAPPPASQTNAWAELNPGLQLYHTQPPAQHQPYAPASSYAPYGSAYPHAPYPQYGTAAAYGAYPSAAGYVYPAYSRQTASTAAAVGPGQQLAPAPPGQPATADAARYAGAYVLNGMQEAMTRFARVSALLEDVLRHLHMLFDAVFGLGYSMGAFRQETGLWLALKTGPVGLVARVVRRVATVWRVLCLFFVSPMAGRFSPVALVLRILGLVPDDEGLELSLADMWTARESTPAEPSALEEHERLPEDDPGNNSNM